MIKNPIKNKITNSKSNLFENLLIIFKKFIFRIFDKCKNKNINPNMNKEKDTKIKKFLFNRPENRKG
tara:strand:+ start:1781 stop:1981 length:201 start_codon:yes stop_codon:yes gene_type:complete